jgi:predicted RNA binding protein YcfA (HicA-like mRNA interferase family)/predicted RNase H-like HicB family nuclease
VKVRDLIRRLETAGWTLKRISGGHRQYRHPDKGMVVTVSGHPGKDVPVGTLRAILRSAGLGGEGDGEERMRFTVIYEKGPASWGAYVPDLPGVISVADSREEVERLIEEAIQLHLEGMREEGIPIPTPSSFAGVIEVNPAA